MAKSCIVSLALAATPVFLSGCGGAGPEASDPDSAPATTGPQGDVTTSLSPSESVTDEPSSGPFGSDCLCIFDVDRTLTGAQGDITNCPGNLVQQGVQDTAYGGGDLTLSELGQALKSTFCSNCYIGSISHGDASGQDSAEQGILHDKLATGDNGNSVSSWTSGCSEINALLTDCHDGEKQTGVPSIIKYYEETAGAKIADKDVYFFDDREINIQSFEGTEYNARQISCFKRDQDGAIGLCGAELSEITNLPGKELCGQAHFSV